VEMWTIITIDGGIAHHGNEVLPKLKQHGVPPGFATCVILKFIY
ncbi:hypothetical protein Tco_1300072, partial [Tanacetum coccineum]